MACASLGSAPGSGRERLRRYRESGRTAPCPVHRETIAADYKRIAAVLAGGGARGGADSRGVAGGGWLTAE